jgi:hypothetical protein
MLFNLLFPLGGDTRSLNEHENDHERALSELRGLLQARLVYHRQDLPVCDDIAMIEGRIIGYMRDLKLDSIEHARYIIRVINNQLTIKDLDQ